MSPARRSCLNLIPEIPKEKVIDLRCSSKDRNCDEVSIDLSNLYEQLVRVLQSNVVVGGFHHTSLKVISQIFGFESDLQKMLTVSSNSPSVRLTPGRICSIAAASMMD